MTAATSKQLIVCDRSNSVLQRPSAIRARSTAYSAFGYCAIHPDDQASHPEQSARMRALRAMR